MCAATVARVVTVRSRTKSGGETRRSVSQWAPVDALFGRGYPKRCYVPIWEVQSFNSLSVRLLTQRASLASLSRFQDICRLRPNFVELWYCVDVEHVQYHESKAIYYGRTWRNLLVLFSESLLDGVR